MYLKELPRFSLVTEDDFVFTIVKSLLSSLSLPKQKDCFNYIKILLRYNSTHLYVCGTYAFSPTCAYIVSLYLKLQSVTDKLHL